MSLSAPRTSSCPTVTAFLRTPTRPVRILLALALTLAVALLTGPRPAQASEPKPTGLAVTASSATTLAVSWSAVAKAPAYKVKYSTSASWSHPAYARTTGTSTTLTGLKAGTTYYVKVRTTKASGSSLSGYSATVKATTAATASVPAPSGSGSSTLRVASYNVTCDKCFDGQDNELHWKDRRAAVAASINAQDLDVIGVQEAGQGWLKDDDGDKIDLSQFEDLRDALGGHWTLTNDKRNNCKKSKTPNDCDYVDQGASDGTRIFYDSAKVTMLDSGSKLLPTVKGVNDRYVAWARLQQRSTGKQFMFATTQLEHTKDSGSAGTMYELRRDQARVVAETVAAHNPGKLPAMVVGDLNSSRFYHDYSPSNAPYDELLDAGYRDPLGGAWKTTKTAPGAFVKHRVHTWMDSFNGFERTDAGHPTWVNGTYIDYILVSAGIGVDEWETVAHIDGDGDLLGLIPSDHNMIRATVVLP